MNELNKKLAAIQKELKAPKSQFNKFANFSYRSCEDILEAVKPLLKDLIVTISDNITIVGDRYYVEATVTLTDGIDSIVVSASARESEVKAGMDSAQITGAASSYARKYALSGLFLIDDTADADTKDNKVETPVKKVVSKELDGLDFGDRAVLKPTSNPKTKIPATTKPTLRQIEAVCKIAKQKGEDLSFSTVKEWSFQECSDYIGNHGNGGYKAKETK